jgi:hypothetical protein
MTEHGTRAARTAIPRPRPAQDDAAPPEATVEPIAKRPTVGEFPWPEPWHLSRGARPRTEYWDVATASWHSRGPIFPRAGTERGHLHAGSRHAAVDGR